MTNDETFEYKSERKAITDSKTVLDMSLTNGLECTWSCKFAEGLFGHKVLHFTWEFNWDELKMKGIDRFTGHITVRPSMHQYFFETQKIDVDLNESNQIIEKLIVPRSANYGRSFAFFEYSMIPYYTPVEEVKEDSLFIFTPSEQNDAILVVDERKIHVNKSFLSCHSEYFSNLFTLDCKDEQVNEIPIGGISYADLKLLLGSISPKPVFPNDKSVEKLLELATRFKVPSVIDQCEYYLLHVSKLGNEKKMLMGENYEMSDLLEKSIRDIDTSEKAKKWKQSPEYSNFSYETKTRVYEKFF